MRPTLFAFSSLLFAVACATSPVEDDPSGGGGVGGKADELHSSCPVDDGDEILAAIENGGSCFTAAALAEACAFGSALDVQFVGAATELCARGFGSMTAEAKRDFDALVERCDAKYESASGTMYRSMAAYCRLEVVTLFNTFYPEPMTAAPAVPYEAPGCPVSESDANKIESAIARASSCSAAADIAERCAWGSAIDVQFASIASDHCTAPTTAADQALHERLGAACTRALADEGGSLGRAATAYCHLQAAVVLDAVLGPVE